MSLKIGERKIQVTNKPSSVNLTRDNTVLMKQKIGPKTHRIGLQLFFLKIHARHTAQKKTAQNAIIQFSESFAFYSINLPTIPSYHFFKIKYHKIKTEPAALKIPLWRFFDFTRQKETLRNTDCFAAVSGVASRLPEG